LRACSPGGSSSGFETAALRDVFVTDRRVSETKFRLAERTVDNRPRDVLQTATNSSYIDLSLCKIIRQVEDR